MIEYEDVQVRVTDDTVYVHLLGGMQTHRGNVQEQKNVEVLGLPNPRPLMELVDGEVKEFTDGLRVTLNKAGEVISLAIPRQPLPED